MHRFRIRSGLAVAIAISATAVVTAAPATGAYASHPGTGGQLTSFRGGEVSFENGSKIPASTNDMTISWAPDGSRFAYVNSYGEVLSTRADDLDGDLTGGVKVGDRPTLLVEELDGNRTHPTWSADGTHIYYSEETGGSTYIGVSLTADGWGDTRLTPDNAYDYFSPDAGPNGVLVAERRPDDGNGNAQLPETLVKIDVVTGAATPIMDNAYGPAVSPDGTRIAFSKDDGQIWTSDMSGTNLVQVTSDARGYGFPTWSPDGATLAFSFSFYSGVGGIATAAADGSQAAEPVVDTHLPSGVPAYQPYNKNHVVGLTGSSRFATAVKISQAHWATAGTAGDGREPAQSVTLSRSDTFADAVSGTALAAAKHGPLLMTPPTSFDAGTKAEIQRILGTNTSATVYLLGSTASVSASTETAIKAMGYTTKRLAGSNRYITSVDIAKEITTNPELILLATGLNFPDALGAGAAAGKYNAYGAVHAVVILTNDGTMPDASEAYIESFLDDTGTSSAEMWAIGKQPDAALTKAGWSGYGVDAGNDRYQTAAKVAETFYAGSRTAGVTTGLNWPDALAGGALLGTLDGPLLLTGDSTTLNPYSAQELSDRSGSLSLVYVFGSSQPFAVNAQIGTMISGPAGYDNVAPAGTAVKAATGRSSSKGPGSTAPKLPTSTKAHHS